MTNWMAVADDKTWADAQSFLALFVKNKSAGETIVELSKKQPIPVKARDLFRAIGECPAPAENSDVAEYIDQLNSNTAVSPVIVARPAQTTLDRPLILDGFHRSSAAFAIDPEMLVSVIIG